MAQAFRALARQRRSVYQYQNKPIPKEILEDVLQTTQRAPSGFNLQPYACVVVQDPDERAQLSTAMLGDNIRKVKDAPLVAVFASDLEPSKRVPAIQQLMETAGQSTADIHQLPMKLRFFGGEGHLAGLIRSGISAAFTPFQAVPTYAPTIAWSYKSTMLAVTHYVLALESHGIGTCVMEGFDETRLRHALDIPDRYSVPVVVTAGYPVESTKPLTLRLDPNEVFFDGKFGRQGLFKPSKGEE
ncbi:unnamed protein product [Aphanomyces euteiches]|uniref:Nitroreductase domain-containing protein n=1 Tax=Aphanomyces euteiches TaxID=100861 RepID=A0A6G0XIZ5_9STRA|nr:hypothetical protein Ae201684_004240 [Aphanomyces euteiches]KAH9094100.1 hypothetical protein Ae201684P_016715 [Aphanomyces euteiches]